MVVCTDKLFEYFSLYVWKFWTVQLAIYLPSHSVLVQQPQSARCVQPTKTSGL